jgi:colicin import membrane protein
VANNAYKTRVSSKIRGNINLPMDIPGNPEAIFEVEQFPTGEITLVKMRKSSGNTAYDDVVYRAIQNSTPLPRPENTEQRRLVLTFRPKDPL